MNAPGDLLMLESWVRHHSRTDARVPCGATETMAFAEVRAECLRRMSMRAAGVPIAGSFVRYLLGHMRVEVRGSGGGDECVLQLHPRTGPERAAKRGADEAFAGECDALRK